ncbi:MAG: Uma2 family endonuclease [Burkholderiales bacterium]|nr:Uma2 family endonuclease [Burkholderiales bacterium]
MGLIDHPDLLRRHRLTVAQYHRMGEAGVLMPGARVELVEGEVVEMAPIGSRHAAAVKRLISMFSGLVADRTQLAAQAPLRLDDQSEPQPDLMLLAPREDFYAAAHPRPADVLLLVEVADTTSRYDREVKLPLYARHGVAEVWLVDLDEGLVHLLREPRDGRYTQIQVSATPGIVAPQALPAAAVDLSPLLTR